MRQMSRFTREERLYQAGLSRLIVSLPEPPDQLGINIIDGRQPYFVITHAAWRLLSQASRSGQVFCIDADFDLCFGGWTNHGKLLFTPQADITFLWGDFKIAKGMDLAHSFLMNGAQRRFGASIDCVQCIFQG